MEKMIEELDFSKTGRGELSLRRRRVPMLDNEIVYEVILNDEFLMSSLFHAAEDALARLGIAAVETGGARLDVVVGGLGLGYTAAAALESPQVGSLRVIEVFPEVIRWHWQRLVPMGARLAEDPRCLLQQGDFFALVTGDGFDPESPGRRFDAVLLDIDHTPEHWLHPDHADFYSESGLREMRRHLKPGGVFAMWADGVPAEAFVERLRRVFGRAFGEKVSFPNPIRGGESNGAVYWAVAPGHS